MTLTLHQPLSCFMPFFLSSSLSEDFLSQTYAPLCLYSAASGREEPAVDGGG